MHLELKRRRRRRRLDGSAAGRGPARSVSAASAAAALPIADGSVASASISTAGFSPRSTERSKLGGMFTTNSNSPSAQASSASASDAKRADVVVAGVLQRRDDRPLVFRMIDREQPGRQVLGVGVDRVAEQKQLHHRQSDDHAQRERVAPHLDPFLAQHSARKRRKEKPFIAAASSGAQQMDEHVFEPRRRLRARSRPSPASRATVALQRGAIHAGDVQRRPNTAAASTPGMPRSRRAATSRPCAGRLEGHQTAAADHLGRRALHDDPPVGEIDDALAAFGLVHVVGRYQDGQPVGRHVVDEVPELAARLGVDAGGRLVEQQQLRLVQHAGGEREPLLPAAGQLAGQLVARGRARPMRSMIVCHRRAAVAAVRRRRATKSRFSVTVRSS